MAASCCWNGGKHIFRVDLDVDVRATFGSAAFLVDDATQRVVSLDPQGRPVELLCADARYTIYSGNSKELRRQVGALHGQLQAARHELARLHERVRKFESCSALGLEQLKGMLQQQQLAPGSVPVGDIVATVAACSAVTADAPAAATGTAAPDPMAEAAAPEAKPSSAAKPTVAASGEWSALPIGHLRTCYVEKNGTPRQGCISTAPAELRLDLRAHAARNGGHELNAAHALEGLGHFSHVWLLWVFDKNGGNMTKSKVRPPRLDGARTGLFSTRTPHRPNNIGLSLARLEGVAGDTLRLSGVDIVDGTPVLDVKPFLPFADTARAEPTRVAPWLQQVWEGEGDLVVRLSPAAAEQLRALLPAMRLLRDEAQATRAIEEVLAQDPRSVHWRQQRAGEEYGFCLDTLNVVASFDGGVATVTRVHHLHLTDRSHLANGPQKLQAPQTTAPTSTGANGRPV